MFSLILRNLVFTILQPGIVAGLIPYLIVENGKALFSDAHWEWQQYIGMVFFALGLFVLTICLSSFIVKGRGTLSPLDPTRRLVTDGLYRFSRNPMYIGVIFILIGETVFFESYALLMYSALVFTGFNLFIAFVEEPRLRRDFGEEYRAYTQKVGRWI